MTTANDAAQAFTHLLLAIDQRDWSTVRARMADEVYTDYQNLFGAEPGSTSADLLVEQWQAMLGPLDATQHLLGTPAVVVDGDLARVKVAVRGYHYAHDIEGGDEWMVGGQYDAELRRASGAWKLSRLRLDTHVQTGNRELLARAGERVRALPQGEGFRIEDVRFTSGGERLTGHLYWPADSSGTVPGVVVLGSWTTVKEQMASEYARRLALQGFAALAFDPTGHGESAGVVRDVESPAGKIEDVRAAAAFLAAHPGIAQAEGVSALGICAGAGYVAGAAAGSSAISRIALVAPWLHDAEVVKLVYGGAEGVATRIRAAQAARARFEKDGVVEYVPAVSADDESAAMFGPFDYYLTASRGAVEAWPNRFAVMAWSNWLEFDPHPFAAKIAQPVLVVHSEEGAVPDGAKRFLGALGGSKRAHWMPGTQFDFYDQDATVGEAVEEVAQHFRGDS